MDHVYEAVCDIDWILLESKNRRMYLFLLGNCQKRVVLTIGGFKRLDLNASLQVLDFFKFLYYFHRIEHRIETKLVILYNISHQNRSLNRFIQPQCSYIHLRLELFDEFTQFWHYYYY